MKWSFVRSLRVEAILALLSLLTFTSEISARYSAVCRPGAALSCEQAGWLIGDCVTYRAIVRAIVDRHTIDPSDWDRGSHAEGRGQTVPIQYSNVSLTTSGKLVPKHPVLFPVVLAPFYAALRERGLLLFNVLQCLALVLLTYRLARLSFGEIASGVAAFGFLVDGLVRNYSYNVSPDAFGAALMLGGIVAIWTPEASRTRLWMGGALLGLALWMRPSNCTALIALLPPLVASVRERAVRRELAWPLAGYAAVAGAFLALNAIWFGSPFVTSYDRVVVLTAGVRSTASPRDFMNRPFLASLLPTFFDAEHGFLQTAPHWPLLLCAAASLARRGFARLVALVVLTFAPVLLVVRYDFWNASAYGNRFFLFSAAVSSVGLAWVAEVLLRSARGPAAGE